MANFWDVAKVIVPVIIAIFASSWGINKYKQSLQQVHTKQINEMQAVIFSSKIVPKIVEIIESINTDKENDATKQFEELLSEDKYYVLISEINIFQNMILEVKSSYKKMQECLNKLTRVVIKLSVASGVLALYYLTDLFSFILVYGAISSYLSVLLIGFFGVLILDGWSNFNTFLNNESFFSRKYDEIIVGV